MTISKYIFTFGSNLAGRHGKGAALYAKENHGAIQGCGVGLQGNSYAIPTKDGNLTRLPLSTIKYYVDKFKLEAAGRSDLTFNLTPIGCGLAGYRYSDIGPLFKGSPPNVVIPDEFKLYVL